MARSVFEVCLLALLSYYADGATTLVTCGAKSGTANVCTDQEFKIVCTISGAIETGISWSRPDNLDVFTCAKPNDGASDSECFNIIEGYELLENTLTRQVLQIKNPQAIDVGKWSCRDGSKGIEHKCDIASLLTTPKIPELKASCVREDNTFNASCTRFNDWDNKDISLVLSVDDVNQNMTAGNFSVIRSNIGGSKVTCYLDGPASSCVSKPIDSVKCPGKSGANTTGVIIGIVLGVVVFIVVVVFVAIWWFRKSKHSDAEELAPSGKKEDKGSENEEVKESMMKNEKA